MLAPHPLPLESNCGLPEVDFGRALQELAPRVDCNHDGRVPVNILIFCWFGYVGKTGSDPRPPHSLDRYFSLLSALKVR